MKWWDGHGNHGKSKSVHLIHPARHRLFDGLLCLTPDGMVVVQIARPHLLARKYEVIRSIEFGVDGDGADVVRLVEDARCESNKAVLGLDGDDLDFCHLHSREGMDVRGLESAVLV